MLAATDLVQAQVHFLWITRTFVICTFRNMWLCNLFFCLHQWGFVSSQVYVTFKLYGGDDTLQFVLTACTGLDWKAFYCTVVCQTKPAQTGMSLGECRCMVQCVCLRPNVRPASWRVWIAVPAVCSQWPRFLSCASVPRYSLTEPLPTWRDRNEETNR